MEWKFSMNIHEPPDPRFLTMEPPDVLKLPLLDIIYGVVEADTYQEAEIIAWLRVRRALIRYGACSFGNLYVVKKGKQMELTHIETRVQRFLRRLSGLDVLVAQDPALIKILVVAASQTNHRDRWYHYETLKFVTQQYVGHGAQNPLLTDERFYEMMVAAIDLLLPAPEIEDAEEEDTRYSLALLRDAITRAVPHAQLPELTVERNNRQSEMVDIATVMKEYVEDLSRRREAYQLYLEHQKMLLPGEDENV